MVMTEELLPLENVIAHLRARGESQPRCEQIAPMQWRLQIGVPIEIQAAIYLESMQAKLLSQAAILDEAVVLWKKAHNKLLEITRDHPEISINQERVAQAEALFARNALVIEECTKIADQNVKDAEVAKRLANNERQSISRSAWLNTSRMLAQQIRALKSVHSPDLVVLPKGVVEEVKNAMTEAWEVSGGLLPLSQRVQNRLVKAISSLSKAQVK